jgi:hypothetical protein
VLGVLGVLGVQGRLVHVRNYECLNDDTRKCKKFERIARRSGAQVKELDRSIETRIFPNGVAPCRLARKNRGFPSIKATFLACIGRPPPRKLLDA